MSSPDFLRGRIAFDPGSRADELEPIPWPKGLAPTPGRPASHEDTDPLPAATVLIVTYTAAEGRALADILTPGLTSTLWSAYTKDWATYEPLLGEHAPARDSKRLGSWCVTRIGEKSVVCFKSELHPATDGPELPILKLWPQLIREANPDLVITTGTAGGVGQGTQLGDVAVASVVMWDCTEQFGDEKWAHDSFPTSPLTSKMATALNGTGLLMAVNEGKIPGQYRKRAAKIWSPPETTVTTDFFAMGDTTDNFGLLKLAPDCRAVEMDDAALGMALKSLAHSPAFFSIRNASDPVMPGDQPISEQEKAAEAIYEKYGYFTTVNSAIACWAIVSAL